MNKITSAFLAAAIAVVLFSCSLATGSNAEPYVPPTLEQFIQSEVKPGGDGTYLIEGDMLFQNLTAVEDFYAQVYGGAASSRSTVNITPAGAWDTWNATDRLNLSFCVDNNVNSWNWRFHDIFLHAMLDACSMWEQYANVEFIYRPDQDANAYDGNPNVEFTVRLFNDADAQSRDLTGINAYGFFPSSPENQHVLHINPEANIFQDDNDVGFADEETMHRRLTTLLAHEIGHILGLRHEHLWMLNANGTYTQYLEIKHPDTGAATPAQLLTALDPNSIMAYSGTYAAGTFSRSPRATLLDAAGVQILYGANAARYGMFFTPPAGSVTQDDIDCSVFMDERYFRYIDGLYTGTYTIPFANNIPQKFIDNLNVSVQNGEIKYSCTYTYKPGYTLWPRQLILNVSRAGLLAEFNRLYPAGYRIRTIDSFVINGEDRYAAVMEAVDLTSPDSWDEPTFVAEQLSNIMPTMETYFAWGYGIKCMTSNSRGEYTIVLADKYYGVKTEILLPAMTRGDFLANFYSYAAQGYWPIVIDSYVDIYGSDIYTASLAPASGGNWTIGWEFKDLNGLLAAYKGIRIAKLMTVY